MTFVDKLPYHAVKIGPKNWYCPVLDNEDNWVAIIEYHLEITGRICAGFVPFNLKSEIFAPRSAKWDVHSYDPLTLTPSLLCKVCGSHGFITEGRWVQARN